MIIARSRFTDQTEPLFREQDYGTLSRREKLRATSAPVGFSARGKRKMCTPFQNLMYTFPWFGVDLFKKGCTPFCFVSFVPSTHGALRDCKS